MEDEEIEDSKYYEKLSNNGFKQNTCWAWRSRASNTKTGVIFLIFGLCFVGVGLLLGYVSFSAYEDSVSYSESGDVTISLRKKLKEPIYIYYEITGLYQNHRRFSGSKSTEQLNGEYHNDKESVESCFPIKTEYDRNENDENNHTIVTPCGLLPKYLFTGIVF